jgi:endonuclease
VRLVIARRSVEAVGRLTTHLPSALRLLIVKADGSGLVHSEAVRPSQIAKLRTPAGTR